MKISAGPVADASHINSHQVLFSLVVFLFLGGPMFLVPGSTDD